MQLPVQLHIADLCNARVHQYAFQQLITYTPAQGLNHTLHLQNTA